MTPPASIKSSRNPLLSCGSSCPAIRNRPSMNHELSAIVANKAGTYMRREKNPIKDPKLPIRRMKEFHYFAIKPDDIIGHNKRQRKKEPLLVILPNV